MQKGFNRLGSSPATSHARPSKSDTTRCLPEWSCCDQISPEAPILTFSIFRDHFLFPRLETRSIQLSPQKIRMSRKFLFLAEGSLLHCSMDHGISGWSGLFQRKRTWVQSQLFPSFFSPSVQVSLRKS